jgi:hypothetical protein
MRSPTFDCQDDRLEIGRSHSLWRAGPSTDDAVHERLYAVLGEPAYDAQAMQRSS